MDIERLEKLGALLERGLLTREEFEAQKAALLMPAAAAPTVAPTPAAPAAARTSAPVVVQVVAPPPTPPVAPVAAPAPEPQPVAPAVLPKPREPTSPVTLALAAVLGGLLLLFIGVPVIGALSDGPSRQTAQAAPAYEEPAAPAAPAKKAAKKRPVFTGTVTTCDYSCAGLFSDCTYVACSVSNTGKAEGTVLVTFSAGSVQSISGAYLMPGESTNLSAKLQGAEEGAPCYCTVEDDSESIGE